MNKEKYSTQKNAKQLMSLDIFYDSLSPQERKKIADRVTPKKHITSPLISWEYFSQSYFNTVKAILRTKDLSTLKSFYRTHNWTNDPATLITGNYDGIVLTNSDLVIEWVDRGFTEMTGYPADFAIGKSPRFLQGQNTCVKTRKRIRGHIKNRKPFTESVINYTKNQTEYRCELNVFPLSQADGKISHFLALEREIK